MAENEEKPRLIEKGFCLKQASIDSVHEKNVRHGHISTLHIWPARRPLAACRAALIATLLPDPGDPEKRKELLEQIGGKVVRVQKRTKKDGKEEIRFVEETEGGILHWGRESGPDLDYFRQEIRKAYGGRIPRILDPFAGGGAIPLEAMRLGCEATAIDINPVAWFIEKCTLEYPQRLAGKKMPLPDFILEKKEFMDKYYEAQGIKLSAKQEKQKSLASFDEENMVFNNGLTIPMADLAWHVRAWGWYIFVQTSKEIGYYYPVLDNKPTVAYLWARTVICKNCRATIPLLKTRWLCKKGKKRVALTMEPNSDRNNVVFGIMNNVPMGGRTNAEKMEQDKKLGLGTMGGSGAWCPCCGKPGTIAMTKADIQNYLQNTHDSEFHETQLIAVVVDGQEGKEYRTPSKEELELSTIPRNDIEDLYRSIPFGLPREKITTDSKGSTWCTKYGLESWYNLFTTRQLMAIGNFLIQIRNLNDLLKKEDYSEDWIEAIQSYMVIVFDRLINQSSAVSRWNKGGEKIEGTFARFALPLVWDFAEVNPLASTSGAYLNQLEWVYLFVEHALKATNKSPGPHVLNQSSIVPVEKKFDVVLTDPPYYDAIPYSTLMDFFYVWLRRTLNGMGPGFDLAFNSPLAIKWDEQKSDGELIDDSARFNGDKTISKKTYEDGMYRVFKNCYSQLNDEGRLVIVFAHKQPDAWETLVTALIKSEFLVDASWPIQTERSTRTRALSSAALSSSVWLVCKKRPENARPGWDNKVLEEMRFNIQYRLREYWDAGIRGPDFIWAATGPALEAYSKHPIVKKADDPGQIMTVTEFLVEVRRIVMDFVVGRVLGEESVKDRDLDNITTYYLLHRHDFGFGDAPSGSCILYAISCDLSDSALAGENDILLRSGGMEEPADDEGEETEEDFIEEGTSSTFRLKAWNKRKSKNLGMDINGRPAPMIDRVHKLMQLWKDGDIAKVDDYLDNNGLLKNKTFHHILQAILELSKEGDEERSLLESISNHITSRGGAVSAPRDLSNFGG